MGELLRLASAAWVVMVLTAGGVSAQDDAKAPKGKAGKAEKEPAEAGAAAGAGEGEPAGPAVVLADLWVLNFHCQKVGIIQPAEGVHRGETYWYMLYQIENKSPQDREAYVSITARSNKSKTYANICAPDIEALIERKVGKPLWGKADEQAALKERTEKKEMSAATFNYFTFKAGKIQDCVAVFNKLDPGATAISITVEGLSNDLHLIERENAPRQIESRIFVIEYERPGDEYAMNFDRFKEVRSGWSKKVIDLEKQVPKDKKEK